MYSLICVFKGNTTRLSLQVSGDGRRVLLVAVTGHVFLWECVDHRELAGVRDSAVKGRWAHISPHEDSLLPCPQDKEATQCTIFVRTEVSILSRIQIICIASCLIHTDLLYVSYFQFTIFLI